MNKEADPRAPVVRREIADESCVRHVGAPEYPIEPNVKLVHAGQGEEDDEADVDGADVMNVDPGGAVVVDLLG